MWHCKIVHTLLARKTNPIVILIQFLYAHQNFDGTYYGIQMSGVRPSFRLSGVNMSQCNLRTTYLNFMKLNIVVSYDCQMICILFG